ARRCSSDWIDGVQPRLGSIRRFAGTAQGEAVDPGVRSLPLDVADAEHVVQPEVAVANRELVAVKRPRCGTRCAIALGVELAAMTRTAKAAGRQSRDKADLTVCRLLYVALLDERRSVRLRRTAHVGAAARHRREARQSTERSVITDVGGTPRYLAHLWVREERHNDESALGKGSYRSEVDRAPLVTQQGGQNRQADGG